MKEAVGHVLIIIQISIHINGSKDTGVRPFACGICNKTFGRQDSLVRHMKTHERVADAEQSISTPPAGQVLQTQREDMSMEPAGQNHLQLNGTVNASWLNTSCWPFQNSFESDALGDWDISGESLELLMSSMNALPMASSMPTPATDTSSQSASDHGTLTSAITSAPGEIHHEGNRNYEFQVVEHLGQTIFQQVGAAQFVQKRAFTHELTSHSQIISDWKSDH